VTRTIFTCGKRLGFCNLSNKSAIYILVGTFNLYDLRIYYLNAKKSNQLKTVHELTPKQRKFVDVLVANWER